MKIHIWILVLLLVVCQGYSQEFNAVKEHARYLDSLKKEYNSYISYLKSDYNSYVDSLVRDYDAYVNQLRTEQTDFVREIREKWGDKEDVQSTQKVWVEYSDTKDSRTIVNFDRGEAVVEVLSGSNVKEDVVKERLEKAVAGLLDSKGRTVEFNSSVVKKKRVTEKPVMTNQVSTEKYTNTNKGKGVESNVLAKSVVLSEKVEHKNVNTKDGLKKVSSIRLQLATDHLPQRARQYSNLIKKYSQMFNVEEPILYAIIEQESAFNPVAKSGAFACGLMQVVPTTGGRDAFRYLYKRDGVPTQEYLFNPENNIKLGTAYFALQMNRYFSGVKDRKSKILCSIAGYNMGHGGVYKAMVGNYNQKEAEKKINAMTPEQLYNHLKVNLHAAETRDYIQKVSSKMVKYIKN